MFFMIIIFTRKLFISSISVSSIFDEYLITKNKNHLYVNVENNNKRIVKYTCNCWLYKWLATIPKGKESSV